MLLINLVHPESFLIYTVLILLYLYSKYGPPKEPNDDIPAGDRKAEYDEQLLDEEL